MFKYIAENPSFLAEAGAEMIAELGRDMRGIVLPEKTEQRIQRGERVGLGRLTLDLIDAYFRNIYDPALVYRWGRCEWPKHPS